MYDTIRPRRLGFVLIEALIALMLISVGLVAVSKLQVLSLSSAGESKSRSEAAVLSQKKLEELRNILLRGTFTGAPLASNTATVVGTNATYAMTWTVSTPSTTQEQRLLRLTTTWTDARNVAQRLDLNSLIAWDDPGSQVKLNLPPGGALIAPTGSAQRGTGINVGIVGTANTDGSRILVTNGRTSLLSGGGIELLVLPAKNGVTQSFTTITGRVYFDQTATVPNSNNIQVRLSSEGECIYNNSTATINAQTAVPNGSNSYKYFTYTCYVGPGWYGNVGVVIDSSVNGNAANATICLGDPNFNGGVSDGTLISAHPIAAATRAYRGFKGTTGSFYSTGVAGGRYYGLPLGTPPTQQTPTWLGSSDGLPDGRPRPSAYPISYPSLAAGAPTDYFDQDFLITRISGNASCQSKMLGGITTNVFKRNAGQYFCINPDNDPASDVCPPIWPGFTVGSSGSINYTLTVAPAGTGGGTVSGVTGGISCVYANSSTGGSVCQGSVPTNTVVTLTAVADSASTFASWSGCTSTSGNSCTVTVTGATTVIPAFSPAAATYALTVSKAGAGLGTVSSVPSGISCGSTCSASYTSGTSVVLTATATSGTFSGWTGGCTGTLPTCTLTMPAAATSVTATFAPVVGNFNLTVTNSNPTYGTVTSVPSGISCGSTCVASYAANLAVVLTAAPTSGATFAGWSGGCSGLLTTCTVTMSAAASVTASFTPPASYNLTVSRIGTGTGTVASAPTGINCGSTCTASFVTPTSVTLTATPDATSTFTSWGGDCSGTGACTVAMSAVKNVTATFTLRASCTTTVNGTVPSNQDTITVFGTNVTGSCSTGNGNTGTYSCTLSSPPGASISLSDVGGNGNNAHATYGPKAVTPTCGSLVNVNFP